MTASSMDRFVRDLLQSTNDYSSLTHRSLREQYLQHVGPKEMSLAEKSLFKQIVEVLISEKAEEKKQKYSTHSDEESEKEDEQNVDPSDVDEPKEERGQNKKSGENDKRKTSVRDKKRLSGEEVLEAVLNSSSEAENSKSSEESDVSYSANDSDNTNSTSKVSKKSKDRHTTSKIKSRSRDDATKTMSSKLKKATNAKSAVPDCAAKKRKRRVVSDSEDSSAERQNKKKLSVSKLKVDKSKKTKREDEEPDSDEDLPLKQYQCSTKSTSKNSESSAVESSDDSSRPNKLGKATRKPSSVKSLRRSTSDDDDRNSRKHSKSSSSASTTAASKKKASGGGSRAVHYLEKIARHCGVMPVGNRYRTVFEDCQTDKQRAEKIEELLRGAGMKGRISMKAAEEVKLQKEIRELSKDNILSSEGRVKRNVFSIYSRQEYKPVPHASKVPANEFSNLRGIVSDGDDSD